MGDKRNYAALDWVIGEIGETLNDARQSLESYVEDPRDTARIRFCLTHIHQVHGSLQMVEFHGASLFAEEMESLAEAIMHGEVVNEKEAQEALMRSLLQLPLYLDQVKALHDDHPGAILPLLNDLRAVRKQSYLSETNLFKPDLSSIETIRGQRHSILSDTVKLKQVFKKLREMYQYAAASVLREIKIEENLGYIEKVLTRLEGVVRGTACHPIWHVSVALIEALIRSDVELSIAVRGLLRQLAQEIKVLEDKCPEALDFPVKESLLRNLLYYVARAENTGGPWVAQVKERYKLDAALLVGGKPVSVQMGKGMISPPEPDAIRAVVVALQDELNTVKHLLDRALSEHGGLGDIEEMLPIVKRIADTLAVMGIGDMRKDVTAQHEALSELFRSGSYTAEQLIELAGGLAKIENRLEAISKGAGRTVDLNKVDEREIELRSATDVVVAECRAGIESVKDAIVDYMSSKWNPEHLIEAVETLHKTEGGLSMIELPRSARVIKVCALYIEKELVHNETIPGESLKALAETIASVDYYLERFADGHGDDLEMYLDLAEEGMAALGYTNIDSPESIADDLTPNEPAEESILLDTPLVDEADVAELSTDEGLYLQEESEYLDESAAVVELDTQEDNEFADRSFQEEITPQESMEVLEKEMIAPTEELDADEEESDIDDEIIEIFVEEAGEVLETLAEYMPIWRSNLNGADALSTIRRAFHTLKGSGRMVEAMEVGELSWSVENMLNRIIDKTVDPQDIHVALTERVMALVPRMVEAFQHQTANPDPVKFKKYIDWANNLAQGVVPPDFDGASAYQNVSQTEDADEPEYQQYDESSDDEIEAADLELTQAESTFIQNDAVERHDLESHDLESHDHEVFADQATDPESRNLAIDEEEEDEDQVLWEIFASEALTHLAVVDEFIESMEAAAPLYTQPTDDLQRALHTLKGSAHMAAITPIALMITPLETFVKELRGFQLKIDNDILQLLKDASTYTREGLECIYTRTEVVIAKQEQFIARVNELNEIHVAPLIHLKERGQGEDSSANPQMLYRFMAQDMNVLMDADIILERWAAAPDETAVSMIVAEAPSFISEHKSLTEGANLANLPEMSALSDQLLGFYSVLSCSGKRVNTQNVNVLKQAHYSLLDMMDQIAAGQNVVGATEELKQKLQSLTDTFSEYTLEADSDIEHHDMAAVDESVGSAWDLEDVQRAETQGQQDNEMEPSLPAAPLDMEDEVLPEASISPAAAAPAPSIDSVIDGLVHIEDDDFDPEILEIFLEEAAELIEELDEAVHAWESDWDNDEPMETMTRALHTFKGGARLCSLKALGELTHEYESYLLTNNGPQSTPNFFEMVHKFQDLVLKSIKSVRANFDGSSAPVLPTAAELPTAGSEKTKRTEQVDTVEQDSDVSDVPHSEQSFEKEDSLMATLESVKSADVIAFKPKENATPVVSEDGGFMVAKQPLQADKDTGPKRQAQDMIKVSSELLEELVNLAGETSISRGRLQQQVSDLSGAVEDIDGTLRRLNEQLRRLDMETEAQVLFRQEKMAEHEQFDSLEMDRYSHLQQLTRSLMESASDLVDLKLTLIDKIKSTETLLLQQSRINLALQEGLMRSRMVPFSRLVPRLRRIVRQVAGELGKNVSFDLDNVEGEMDRSVLERMIAPLEHMLRNAVDHGIEMPDGRQSSNKPEVGRILLSLSREGGDILIRLADDGRGINLDRVKQKAVDRGLISKEDELSDHDIMQFILEAGFSTAESVTQISGRGVGMDVVAGEIKQLGGSIMIDSKFGVGTQFTVRLPFTVSVNRALMVQLGLETFAIPLNTIEGIVRVSPFELEHYYSNPAARFEYAGEQYKVRHLGSILNHKLKPKLDGQVLPLPVILVRSAQHTMALQVDALQGSREIVVKSLGSQFSSVQGLSGATITGDGSVVVILDPHAIVRREMSGGDDHVLSESSRQKGPERAKLIMVVDDSVTVRKVTTRFLERQGYEVITAKDGIDALQALETETPDLMLLDIEMPRMDGFEVAKNMRSTKRCRDIPIVMITSRTGDKHRQHALSIGVNEYVGKPFQEDALIKIMNSLLGQKSESA